MSLFISTQNLNGLLAVGRAKLIGNILERRVCVLTDRSDGGQADDDD